MKNPLTSKERRGLAAVAAAALLCVSSGFIFRNCGPRRASEPKSAPVVVDSDSSSWMAKERRMPDSVEVRRPRRVKRKKTVEKTYPVRSPLDEPCD